MQIKWFEMIISDGQVTKKKAVKELSMAINNDGPIDLKSDIRIQFPNVLI